MSTFASRFERVRRSAGGGAGGAGAGDGKGLVTWREVDAQGGEVAVYTQVVQ